MRTKKRVLSLLLICALVLPMFSIHVGATTSENTLGKDDLTYMDVRDENNALSLHGLYMDKESDIFPRMDLDATTELNSNAKTHAKVSAGGRIRFSTDSSYIAIKAEFPNYITYSKAADADMGKGKYGFDVYVDTEEGSTYITTIAPETTEVPTENKEWSYEGVYDFGTPDERNITIYFPTLQEVSEVYVGVQETATVDEHKIAYEDVDPIVYYGSSITQGASAKRPGLTYVNTIGRSINRDYINLGMFGGCKGETAFADYIAGLNMSIFVMDHDHNYDTAEELANGDSRGNGHEAFYKVVRKEHPDIPIVFISRPSKTHEWEDMREVIKQTYHNAIANGDQNVYFIDGQSFFNGSSDFLASDGVHPNDKGQAAMARVIGNVLTGIVNDTTPDDSYWFKDDFSYTAEEFKESGWTNQGKLNLDEETGTLQVGTSGNESYTYLMGNTGVSTTWNDFTFEADITITNTKIGTNSNVHAWLVVGGEADDSATAKAKGGYQFQLRNNGRVYLIDRKGTSEDAFDDVNKNVGVAIGPTYNMKIVTSGKTITCYLDGKQVLTATSGLDEENPYAGYIGIRVQTNLVEVDNVCVYSNNANPHYEECFDSADSTDVTTIGWTDSADVNSVSGGQLQVGKRKTSNGGAYSYLNACKIPNTMSKFTVEADVTITNASYDTRDITVLASLVIGADSTSDEGYQLMISSTKNNAILQGVGDKEGNITKKTKSNAGIEIGKPYKLKLVVNNNVISGYLNDQLVGTSAYNQLDNDASPFAGYIGIRGVKQVVTVDNVVIRSEAQLNDNYYNVSYYRNGLDTVTHPYRDGYVFGGWYADPAYETPLAEAVKTGYAYAKWVAEEVLSVKAQLSAGGVDTSTGTIMMRLVSTADCDDYIDHGFYVETVNNNREFDADDLLSSIKSRYDDVTVDYTPSGEFHETSTLFSTIILKNLKATNDGTTDHLNKEFTIKPFWKTADGTKVYGVTRVLTIQEGLNKMAESVVPFSL